MHADHGRLTEQTDCESFEAHIFAIGVPRVNVNLATCHKVRSRLNTILQSVNFGVNNVQFATAYAAIKKSKKLRCMVTMPSGQGKSRVIAALIAIRVISKYTDNGFAIVFSSYLLKEVDRAKYERLATALGVAVVLVVYDPARSLDSQLPNRKCCVLIDEADMVLLDNAATLQNLHVFGLSATILAGGSSVEALFLKKFNFDVVDSNVPGYVSANDYYLCSLREYMSQSANYAKLVYLNSSQVAKF